MRLVRGGNGSPVTVSQRRAEEQGGEVTCPRAPGWEVAEWGCQTEHAPTAHCQMLVHDTRVSMDLLAPVSSTEADIFGSRAQGINNQAMEGHIRP